MLNAVDIFISDFLQCFEITATQNHNGVILHVMIAQLEPSLYIKHKTYFNAPRKFTIRLQFFTRTFSDVSRKKC